jgi:hypothetical protein
VPALVTLTAAGADGTPYYRGRVAPPEGTPKSPPSGSRITFDARPGQLQLRMSIEGTDSVVLDTETQEVSVPDLTAPQTALGTPAVFRARTAREFQLLQTNPDAVPTAGREFSRNERVLVRAPAYGPGGSTPTVTARVLNRGGQPVFDLQVSAAPETGPAMEVPVARLAPGEYLIEIKAAGPGGETTELVAFRLVG